MPPGGVNEALPAIETLLASVKLSLSKNDSIVPYAIESGPVPSALLLPITSVPAPSVVTPIMMLGKVNIAAPGPVF